MFRQWTLFTVLFSVFLSFSVNAEIKIQETECLEFKVTNSPQNMDRANAQENRSTWCYTSYVDQEKKYRLIFNADQEKLLPLLSALASLDNDGRILSVAHGSGLRENIDLVNFPYQGVSPFSVPLDVFEAKWMGGGASVRNVIESRITEIQSMASRLQSVPLKMNRTKITPGVFKKYLEPEKFPYGGYWWPMQDLSLSYGNDSPLAKYDAFVQAKTGFDPGSLAWENATHTYQNVAWGGHCNGWAASSLLYKEITNPVFDDKSNVTFSTSDVNGILAEVSFCAEWAFYGKRYNDSTDELTDIHADLFHKVLTYYLHDLNKPIVMDYITDASVDNHVITGYELTITEDSSETNLYHVNAVLDVAGYDMDRNEALGPETNTYKRNYEYDLKTNDSGEILNGTWTGGSNPDFLWYPLAEKNCAGENPKIKLNWVNEIMKLPAETR